MMTTGQSKASLFGRGLLLVLLLTASAIAFKGQAQQLDAAQKRAISALAQFTSHGSSIDRHLTNVGFAAPSDTKWRGFPAVRKLEAAFRSARAASPDDGQRFLAAMSRALAKQYAPAGHDPVLRALSESRSGAPKFASVPTLSPAQEALSSQERAAIRRIADFADGVALGGLVTVLEAHAGLDADTAYDVALRAESNEQALLEGFSRMEPQKRDAKLVAFVAAVDKAYTTARGVVDLEPYRRSRDSKQAAAVVAMRPTPDDPESGGPGTEGQQPSGGPKGPRRTPPKGSGPTSGAKTGDLTASPSPATENNAESPEIESFKRGVGRGWIVTRNPSTGKLFVHTSQQGNSLVDLRYLIEESPDGRSWTVYEPEPGPSGTRYGRKVGTLKRPKSVHVGQCGCM